MNNLSRIKWFLGLTAVLLTAVFVFRPVGAQQGMRALERARQRVAANGAYTFTADIGQALIPRLVLLVVGESSRVDMQLEGEVVVPDKALWQLWSEEEGEHWKDVHLVNPAERRMTNDRQEPCRSPGFRLK